MMNSQREREPSESLELELRSPAKRMALEAFERFFFFAKLKIETVHLVH